MHIDERGREEHTHPSEKEADVKRERDNLQDALRKDILATLTASKATGQAHQQPWRTEPEIELARQLFLARCLATIPDITQGIYPFKGMKLSRADVEWLLATYENGRDPGAGSDEQQQNHWRLDLRGADLHALPLARLRGSLTREEWDEATEEQRATAAVLLTGADLSEVHLEGAYLNEAHLERTFLYKAHLEGAILSRTYIEEAQLKKASESGEQHIGLSLADAQWGNVNLAVVQWSQVDMLGDEYEARHPLVPSENPLPSGRRGADGASFWAGPFRCRAGLRLPSGHHHRLAVSRW